MTSSPRLEDRPTEVAVVDGMLRVTLADGRQIATPLTWYPRLAVAPTEALNRYELGLAGIHWPDIDEDISVKGMLQGVKPPVARKTA